MSPDDYKWSLVMSNSDGYILKFVNMQIIGNSFQQMISIEILKSHFN